MGLAMVVVRGHTPDVDGGVSRAVIAVTSIGRPIAVGLDYDLIWPCMSERVLRSFAVGANRWSGCRSIVAVPFTLAVAPLLLCSIGTPRDGWLPRLPLVFPRCRFPVVTLLWRILPLHVVLRILPHSLMGVLLLECSGESERSDHKSNRKRDDLPHC